MLLLAEPHVGVRRATAGATNGGVRVAAVDVGDPVEVIFNTESGATVVAAWIDPDGALVIGDIAVPESESTPGAYPYTFVPTRHGVWEARFTVTGPAPKVERYWVRAQPPGPPPLATVTEVGAQYGTLTPAQETLTRVLLRHASSMVRSRYPDLAQRVAEGRIAADAAGLAVVNMVLRVLRNPNGLRAETTGPFSRTYDTSAAAGLLVITDTETALLEPPKRGGAKGVGTIWVRPGMVRQVRTYGR